MKKTTESDGDAPGRENVHELRLVALLLDLVERHGRADTAEILGVSYDTVARAAASGRLTGRVIGRIGAAPARGRRASSDRGATGTLGGSGTARRGIGGKLHGVARQ